jgi:hypothetical protein
VQSKYREGEFDNRKFSKFEIGPLLIVNGKERFKWMKYDNINVNEFVLHFVRMVTE